MPKPELKVWTEEWDGTPVIAAEGEVDLGTVDQLRSVTTEVVRRGGVQQVIFDLRKVTYIDSSGLGILVSARRRLGSGPDPVIVITEQPSVLLSLRITGLDRVLRVEREPHPVTAAKT